MFANPSDIRAQFSAAMSQMYRTEVPAYADLIDIVADTNKDAVGDAEDINRISEERHGAIRLGTAAELSMMRRVFAVMGMYPVGYYDLSVASIPVHSTAFRPVDRDALSANPFRVFTSLLRLELIEDQALRTKAETILQSRKIFSDGAIGHVEMAEADGGLMSLNVAGFIDEVLKTFRWNSDALVDLETYHDLHNAHRLIADVVSFKGPHINHLTPRTMDIDKSQRMMTERGLPAKAVVEGPPRRKCPILLRQTSFKALEEPIAFAGKDKTVTGTHTARFGEIEQRGAALTPKGRTLYDKLLNDVRARITPAADGSNAAEYESALEKGFQSFPDDWQSMHDAELAYFRYDVDKGALTISPITYEDFLPVSAAGIFQSNLGDGAAHSYDAVASKDSFETALGAKVQDEFALYAAISKKSLAAAQARLGK